MTNDQGRVKITGPMTVESVESLLRFSALAAGKTDVVIDLQQVDAVDSAAVSLMLA